MKEEDEFKVHYNYLPEGAKLFFLNNYPGTIYVLSSSAQPKILINDAKYTETCGNFDISRDGKTIVFASSYENKWYIYIADLDLVNNKALNASRIPIDGEAQDPKFSFNGKEIVYKRIIRNIADPSIYTGDIYKCNIDGTSNTMITNTAEDDWAPVFSADNKYIAFGRRTDKEDPPGDIAVYQDAKLKVVTYSDVHDWYPAFSYDGDLLFVCKRSNECIDDIYKLKREDLERTNPAGLAVKIIPSILDCDNSTEADPSIVYGNNNCLIYVSDQGVSTGKYGVYLYSFLTKENHLIVSKDNEELLGPIVYCGTDLKKGLAAEWLFNGNCNDNSGNENNGKLNGPIPTTDRYGRPNTAYLFDGVNDYIEVNNSTSLNIIDQISISMWAKFETNAPYYYPYHMIEKHNCWGMGQRKNEMGSTIFTSTNQFHIWSNEEYGVSFQFNRFYHFVMTYDGTKLSFYADGILRATTPASGLLTQNANKVYIGRYNYSGDYFFDGTLDDIRIYNRALTIAEVNALYNE